MAEPIAALIVRILADTSEMVTGVKKATDQLDGFENRVAKVGKALASYFTIQAVAGFAKEIVADVDRIDNAAKRLGSSSEEFQRFSFAVEQSGADAEVATAGIVSLTERLGDGDAGLLSVLRKLNINIEEFRAKDPVSRFVELGTAIANVTDPTERLELRLEAMGQKGEKALASVDQEFSKLAENAPIYSEQSIQAIKQVEDEFDRLWMKVKVGAAETLIKLKEVWTFKAFFDAVGTTKLDAPGLPDIKNTPNNNPAPIGAAPLDPNNVKAVAVAVADLNEKLVRNQNAAAHAKEQLEAMNDVLKLLKMEVPNLAAAMEPFLAKFETSTKVENMTRRIIDLANRIAGLREEQERLMEVMNPGSTKVAGDDVDAQIFALRSDPRNWGSDGNLTPQALELESGLINTFSLQMMVNMLRPQASPAMPGMMGAPFPGAMVGGPSITVNAQGSWFDSPDRINQLARRVEDSIAQRSGLSNTFTRR